MEEWVSGSSENDPRNQVFALHHSTIRLDYYWLIHHLMSLYTSRKRYGYLDRYRHKLPLSTLDTLHGVSRLMTVLCSATCDCSLIDRIEQTVHRCGIIMCRFKLQEKAPQEPAVKERVIDVVRKVSRITFLYTPSREIWKFTD